jgi:hypothetical protein
MNYYPKFITVMLTFLCRDRDRPVTVPSPFCRTPSPLRPPCVPRVKRSFSVPKRSLIYDRFKAFLNVFKPFLSVLKRHKLKNA